MTFPSLPPLDIHQTDTPQIAWLKVTDALSLLWADNPKLHDIGAVAESITRYGFQELPKYDATLKAIKAGNGRIEALAWMEKQGQQLPRGLAQLSTGEWAVPVLVGVDAASIEDALAYAVDSNNLVLSGGNMDFGDMLRLWDQDKLTEVLVDLPLDMLPVSVTAETFNDWLQSKDGNGDKQGDTANGSETCTCPVCGKEHSALLERGA